MNMKNMKRTRLMSCVLAVVMVISLMLSLTVSTSAAPTANQAVNDAKNGVVQIQVWFNDPETATEQFLQSGTGFLINDTTVVTCQHVVTAFSPDWYVKRAQEINKKLGQNRTAEQIKACLELRVMVLRDVYVKASVKHASTEMDYALLTLAQPVNNRSALKLRDSSTLVQTEAVFALGFPGDIDDLRSKHDYDADDVTITSGNVNTVTDMTFETIEGGKYENVNCVESSALIIAGNSGGPLVDANGAVVGINAAGKTDHSRNMAVSSKQLIDVLKALGIEYTPADEATEPTTEPSDDATTSTEATDATTTTEAPIEPPVEDEVDTDELAGLIEKAEAKNAVDYTEESYDALKSALKAAKSALKSDKQEKIDNAAADLKDAIDALEAAEDGNDMILYIAIGGGALVLIIVIVLIVVLGGKKKAAPATPATPATPVTPVAPVKPVAPVTPGTTVLNQGAGATTVLSQNAGATTVLSQNVNGGTLVRVATGERIAISAAEFTIGRERNMVDYCIANNTNVSRVHARFVVRDGITYVVDNKAANGTYVNGVKSRAGQEIELKNGDQVVLADEKFEYNK